MSHANLRRYASVRDLYGVTFLGLPPARLFRRPAIRAKYAGPFLAVSCPPSDPRNAAGVCSIRSSVRAMLAVKLRGSSLNSRGSGPILRTRSNSLSILLSAFRSVRLLAISQP